MASLGVRYPVPPLSIPPSFRKNLRKKPKRLQAAIEKCVRLLGENPRHQSLRTHKIRGAPGVLEAYADTANRVTFRWDDEGGIQLLAHCNHDVIKKATRR